MWRAETPTPQMVTTSSQAGRCRAAAIVDEPSKAAPHQVVCCRTGPSSQGVAHSLRHSYTTLLRRNGNDPKVIQDLLRHASYSITANVYDSAVSDEKREAHSGVMRLVATRTSTRSQAKDGKMASA
jgi:integrase